MTRPFLYTVSLLAMFGGCSATCGSKAKEATLSDGSVTATGGGGSTATGEVSTTGGTLGTGGGVTGGSPTGGAATGGARTGGTTTTATGGTKADTATTPDAPPTNTGSNPSPTNPLFLGTNFWNEGWEPASDYWQRNVDWATTTNPWNPTLLSELAAYKARVIRFMDWNRTNDQVAGTWAARAKPTVAPDDKRGVAYEWQIDLCNRIHADYWLNVVTLADDDHITQLAKLVQEKLDPSLRVYLEYSNEVWNGAFLQADYAIEKGVAANLPGQNKWYQGWAWYVQRSVQVFQVFESVWGKNSPRLVRVLSGQAGYQGDADNPAPVCRWHLDMLANKTVNPTGETFDAYAIAPYFGGKTIAELKNSVASTALWVQNHSKCLEGTGIPLIAYEGGQDSFAAPDCTAVQSDPALKAIYLDFLNGLKAAGMTGPFAHYTHVGTCWGLKIATGDDPSKSPKFQAAVEWAAANP